MKHHKNNINNKVNFFRSEISVGICIFFSVVLALSVSNSSANFYYVKFFDSVIFSFAKQKFTINDFINNILLLLFFLLMAIELKKELIIGELSISKRVIFSVFACVGSTLGAIIVFYISSYNKAIDIDGFLTSCLTDGALFYCLIKLCGNFFHNKIIAIALAITSVNNAILIVLLGTFYSNFELMYLFLLVSIFACFFIFKYCNFYNLYIYIFTAIVLWFLLWLCNIPQVLAGVVLGLFLPLKYHRKPVAIKIGKNIAPIVNFLVLPLFIFANTGLDFTNFDITYLIQPMIISVCLSLMFGKQMGFLLCIIVIYWLNITHIPNKIGWGRIYCLAIFNSASLTYGLFFNSILFKENIILLNQTKLALILANFSIILFGFIVVYLVNFWYKFKIDYANSH